MQRKQNNTRVAGRINHRPSDVRRRRGRSLTLAVAACFGAAGAGIVFANPVNPTVTNGAAQFTSTGNLLTITNSPNTIINWGSFSIGASEITRFVQQSASSLVLNRVLGQNPSAILGALQSNGRVMLINPNGIVFGAGSQINVAGLTASTLNITDADFLAGRFKFADGLGNSVINNGNITAAGGGNVYLVGSAVTNNGIITSPNGEVVLAAGNSVELVNPGTPDLRVQISAPDNQAVNLGSIVADSGRVGIYAGLITHGGSINADSVTVGENGQITLQATQNTTLQAGSTLTANGPTGGSITIQSGDTTEVYGTIEAKGSAGQGGTVQVLGNLVGLAGQATLDASGAIGGGTVLVGGDLHGANADVQNAFRTFVGQDVTIKADATQAGDGGKVVVWSDDITRYYGNISAKGGAQSGNGGQVETSGHNTLDFQGAVDTTAANGNTGTLLLDPSDITITGGAQNSGSIDHSGPPTFSGSTGTETLSLGELTAALGISNVTIDASTPVGGGAGTGTITVGTSVAYNSPNFLTFTPSPAGTVVVSNPITNTGTGNINFTGNTAVNANITTNSGNIAFSNGDVTVAASLITTSGAISDNVTGATNHNFIWQSGTISSGGSAMTTTGNVSSTVTGAVTLTGKGWDMGDAVVTNTGDSAITGLGQVSIGTGATWTVVGRKLSLQSNPATPVTGTGTLIVNAGAQLVAGATTSKIGDGNTNFINQGTVTVNNGSTLQVNGGNTTGIVESGTWTIGTGAAGNASLVFSGGVRTLNGPINGLGPGTLTVAGGEVIFNPGFTYDDTKLTGPTLFSGGNPVFNTNVTFSTGLTNTGSTVQGSGDLTVSGGNFIWNLSGGALTSVFNGTGKVIVNVPATLGAGNLMLAREMDLNKGFTLTGGNIEIDNNPAFNWVGTLVSGDGATASNSSITTNLTNPLIGNGTFLVKKGNTLNITPPAGGSTVTVGTFTNNGGMNVNSGTLNFNDATFQNGTSGTLTVSGGVVTSGPTTQFTNSGVVAVNSGSLTINGGNDVAGADSGTYHAAGAAGTITFAGGTRTFGSASAVGVPGDQGTVFFSGGTTKFASGSTVEGTGDMVFSGGTAEVMAGATYNLNATTSVQGGTLIFDTSGTTGTLAVSSGSLSGSGAGTTLNVTTNTTNGLHWMGGTIDNTNLALVVAGEMNIDLTGQAAVLTNAANDFQNSVEVKAASAQITDKNAITLGTLNVTNDLTVNAGGTLQTGTGTVGGALTLGTTAGNINIAGDVTTTGAQTYNGPVAVGANAKLSTTNSDVSFNGTVTLGAGSLTVADGTANTSFKDVVDGSNVLNANGSGTTTFSKGVGGGTALTSLSVTGVTNINGGAIKTSGNQIYSAGVAVNTTAATLTTSGGLVAIGGTSTLGQDLTISSGTGGVTLSGGMDGPGALTVNSGGATNFNGTLGATTRLASVTTDSSGNSRFVGGSAIHTTGNIALNDPVIGNGFTLDSKSGAVSATNAGNNFTGNFTVDAVNAALSSPGALNVTFNSNGAGTVALSAATSLTATGNFSTITAAGSTGGGAISLHSTAPVVTLQTVATSGGNIDLGADNGDLVMAGAIVSPGGSLTTMATGAQTLSGSINVANYTINAGGSGLTLQSGSALGASGTLTNAGTLNLGGQFLTAGVFNNNGTLTGNGTIGPTGTVIVNNNGTISPGNSPGTIVILGDFNNTGGILNIELAGPTQFDRISVNGNTTLSGTLNVLQLSGFVPSPGEGFQVITTQGTSTGTFSFVNVAPAFSGMSVTYNSKFTDLIASASSSPSSPSSSSSSSSSQGDDVTNTSSGTLTTAMDQSDGKKKLTRDEIAAIINELIKQHASSCQ